MGRGIGPGTKLSPDQFSAFQETNDALTMPNDVYIWTASFSDDNNPIAKWAKLLSGEVQTALDRTWAWSERNFVDYHLSGKKAPQYFVYRKTGDKSSPQLSAPPMLGSTPIERAYEALKYLKLCEFLNMPTLRDLAIRDARVLLKQWLSYRPEQFVTDADGYIVSAVDRKPDSLLVELIELSKQSIHNWYPEYNEWRKTRKDPLKRHLRIEDKFKPAWMQFWEKVNVKYDSEGNKNFKFKNNLFIMMCRDHFDVLEPYSRARKQIITPIKVFEKRRAENSSETQVDEATSSQVAKRHRPCGDETISRVTEGTEVQDLYAPMGTEAEENLPAMAVVTTQDFVEHVAHENPLQPERQTRTETRRKRKRSGEEPTPQETVAELSCGTGFPPFGAGKTGRAGFVAS